MRFTMQVRTASVTILVSILCSVSLVASYSTSSTSRLVKREPSYDDSDYTRPMTGSAASLSSSLYRPKVQPASSEDYQPESSQSYPPRSYNNKPVGYGKADQDEAEAKRLQDEEDKKPSQLELLLGQSKFSCGEKKDGYYADTSVGCQVFHYCVGGAKHSWMCPDQTVFHQVHLNCVPAAQDICSQSEKFYVVNEYLHKEIDSKGPNNTIRYHQRFYPEEFLGDALQLAPQSFGYPPVEPAPRQAYASQPKVASRPSRPTYAEDSEADYPKQNYRPQSYAGSSSSGSSPYKQSSQVRPASSYPSASSPSVRKPVDHPAPQYNPYGSSSYPSQAARPSQSSRPISSSSSQGLRYSPSSGSPVTSYNSPAPVRATISPVIHSSYSPSSAYSQLASQAAGSYSPTSRTPLTLPYSAASSLKPSYPKGSGPSSKFSYGNSASYPTLSSSSPSSSDLYGHSSYSGSDAPSLGARFSSAFTGSDIPLKTGVVYESDY